MKLEKIITLANKTVYLRFIAMERSLRATGCQLPLLVIPYNNDLFDLPANAQWLVDDELFQWLSDAGQSGVYRKYICLMLENYLFVDSDVIFLRNPVQVLEPVDGFITSCGHWHNTLHTTLPQSEAILRNITTNWQARVFNSGQFACSRALYSLTRLMDMAAMPTHSAVCLSPGTYEQPAINLLVNLSGVTITNLTLPPYNMESTWAGDYNMDDYEKYWANENKKPFIIHWAGRGGSMLYRIDLLFFEFLNNAERGAWKTVVKKKPSILKRGLRKFLSIIKN